MPFHLRALPVLAALVIAMPASAQEWYPDATFYRDAYWAANRGIQVIREAEAGTGFANGVDARANAMASIALMRMRSSSHLNAGARNYRNSTPDDQALLRRMMRSLIDRWNIDDIAGTHRQRGLALWAMSLYLSSGGPNDVEAGRTVFFALESAVQRLRAGQAPSGSWNGSVHDTFWSAFGLSAASTHIADADRGVDRADNFLRGAINPDGGYGDLPGTPSTVAATAAALWTHRLAGAEWDDDYPQWALAWLHAHQSIDEIVEPNAPRSALFEALWLRDGALRLCMAPGDACAWHEAMLGELDPATVGIVGAPRHHGYDTVHAVLELEDDVSGRWLAEVDRDGWLGQAMAIHLLRGPSGRGVCIDDDHDGVCAGDDNCLQHPNPRQDDRDGDGVGDACDNCPLTRQRDQSDRDGDGIGDVCDERPDTCDGPERGGQEEVCNGVDDDCDGLIDEGDWPEEVCNGADDDCDWHIDEGDFPELQLPPPPIQPVEPDSGPDVAPPDAATPDGATPDGATPDAATPDIPDAGPPDAAPIFDADRPIDAASDQPPALPDMATDTAPPADAAADRGPPRGADAADIPPDDRDERGGCDVMPDGPRNALDALLGLLLLTALTRRHRA